MRKGVIGLLSAFALMMVAVAPVLAQEGSSIKGRVTDPQGGVVVNASVRLTGPTATQTVRTASDGTFVFSSLAASEYVVQIDAPGFFPWRQSVAAGAPQLVVTMQIAGVNEDVTVSATIQSTLVKPDDTGSRLGLTPLDIPASVQILSGATVRERGDLSVSEATTRAVGVTTQWTVGNGGGGLSARGFTTVSSVKQLYDGVQMFIGANTVTFPFDPWTVDRIEVLGGPASVLYGNGAIGGAVNVIPRQPNTSSSETTGRLIYGTDNTWRAALDSSGPLNGRTAYRFDVSRNTSDGWFERGQSANTAVSGALRRQVSPTLAVSLTEDFGDQHPPNYYGIPLINGTLDESLRRVNYNVTDADTSFQDNWTQLKADWFPSSSVSVHSRVYFIAAERFWHRIGNYTFQSQTNQVLRERVMEVRHHEQQVGNHTELVVKQPIGSVANDFSACYEFDWVRFHLLNNNPATGSVLSPLTNPTPGLFVDFQKSPTLPVSLTHSKALSAFAEDRLSIAPKLALVGGLRADAQNIDRRDLQALTSASRTFTPVTGRGGVVYNVEPKLVVYGQYSAATDSIGDLLTQSPTQQILDLPHGRQVEGGVKQSLLEDRAEWSVAAYRIVKNKLTVPDPNNFTLLQQVGQQSSYGVEATVAFPIGAIARIEVNGTLLHAQFDDFSELVSGRPVSRVRNRPPNVPETAANAWFTWNVAFGWQVRAGLRYVGERFIDNANTWRMPGYSVVDAGIRRRLSDRLTADVRVYNAFDEVYALGFWNGNTASQQWLLGPPRRAELGLTTSF